MKSVIVMNANTPTLIGTPRVGFAGRRWTGRSSGPYRRSSSFFKIRDIGCDAGDDPYDLGVEPCDRNGVGHGDMVAPAGSGTTFRSVGRVTCEALMTDERIDFSGMRNENIA